MSHVTINPTPIIISGHNPTIRNNLIWNGTSWEAAIPPLARRPILTEIVTLLPKPTNSTLGSGHEWKFSQEYNTTTSNLNYTTEGGLASQCVKLTTKGTGGQAVVQLTRQAAINLKGKHVKVWLLIPTEFAGTLNDITVIFGSGSEAFKGQLKQTICNNFGTEPLKAFCKSGEWFPFTIEPMGLTGRVGSEINWEAIQDFRIGIEDNKTGETGILFGGLEIVTDTYPEGVVSWTHDDNYLSQWEKLYPMFQAYGWKASLYLTMSRINEASHLTLEQIKHLQQVAGWDVSVHCDLAAHNVSPTEGMTPLTETEILNDLRAAQERLAELGLEGANHWAIPSGIFNQEFLAFTPQLFSSARAALSNGGETVPPADRRRLRISGMTNGSKTGNNAEVGSMKWVAKETKAYGGWAIFLIHSVAAVAEEPNTLEEKKVKELVEEVAAQGLLVRKISEVLGV
jgi:peptidoglycan/xylan/chitin deacetylase (PgdA/CDA1 family)